MAVIPGLQTHLKLENKMNSTESILDLLDQKIDELEELERQSERMYANGILNRSPLDQMIRTLAELDDLLTQAGQRLSETDARMRNWQ